MKKGVFGAAEMTRWVKTFVTKADGDLHAIPGMHPLEGGDLTSKSCPLTSISLNLCATLCLGARQRIINGERGDFGRQEV